MNTRFLNGICGSVANSKQINNYSYLAEPHILNFQGDLSNSFEDTLEKKRRCHI